MSKSVLQWMEAYIRRAFRSRVWHKFMQMMVCVVVFCTTYALILPALTMEQQYACGIEAHLHGETCYELRTNIDLICTPESMGLHTHSDSCGDGSLCGYRETPIHTHEAVCYDAGGSLICPLEELAEHIHGDGCYEAGPLVCPLEEIQGHAHGETCYETGPLVCSLEESQGHAHSEVCHDENGVLICTLEETQGHTHDSSCHGPAVVTCGLEEQTGHTHDAACYGPAVLTCAREVIQAHTHSEACLDENGSVVCGVLQTVAHQHDESCVSVLSEDKILVCGVEEHIHASSCNSDPEADVESREQWVAGLSQVTLTGQWAEDLAAVARSQLGYQESQLNFLMDNGARKGYTRYGHWFGITYADWDAMFVSFCLRHAGIPEEAIAGSAYSDLWLSQLQELGLTASLNDRFPAPGEIVFFRAEDGSVHSGVIHAVDTEPDLGGVSQVARLRVIAGNIDNRVTEVTLAADKVMTVVSLEQASLRYEAAPTEAPTEIPTELPSEVPTETPTEPVSILTQQAETENYIVTVAYSADLVLPEGAELRVSEYAKDSEAFFKRCEEVGYELEWLLNIGFYVDDTELELDGAFDVQVTSKQGQTLGQDITHFADEGTEQLDAVSVEEAGQSSVQFVAGGFSDFGGGVAVLAAAGGEDNSSLQSGNGPVLNYAFTTANPADLQEGVDYAIYVRSGGGNTYIFLNGSLGNLSATGTGYWSPYNIGQSWDMTTAQMGTTNAKDFTWRVQKSGSQYYLVSQKTGQRLTINRSWGGASLALSDSGTLLTNTASTGIGSAGAKVAGNGYNLRYNNGWSGSSNNSTDIFFARVSPRYGNYPDAVVTDHVSINRLRFFNFRGDGDGTMDGLENCIFEIRSEANPDVVVATVTSGADPLVEIPLMSDGNPLPDGKYTITEVSSAPGYIPDLNPVRHFEVKNGIFVEQHNIGYFINHPKGSHQASKTGVVEDYKNRIYKIMLEAGAQMQLYAMDPVDIRLVVDQSNSMLFPSGLKSTGKYVYLGINDGDNDTRMNNLNLDKDQVYYIISDPAGTSTVWAVWHNGETWVYQDASYYAKAKHDNSIGYQTPTEQAIFPINDTYTNQPQTPTDPSFDTARVNGGALDKDMTGSGLGNYLKTLTNSHGTFEVYTASDKYNRLHYLEQAMAYLVCELADINSKSKVSLTFFTKEVDHSQCIESKELTPEHVTELLNAVDAINTSGGTRQDIALEHVASAHPTSANYKNYTVLITDGAPVLSGSNTGLTLGSPSDSANTGSSTVYGRIKGFANSVKAQNNTTLMTVALGMKDVAGGSTVLENIATPGYHFAYNDASHLIEAMQQLIYQSLRPYGYQISTGSVTDEISDSFYPIAWVGVNAGGQPIYPDGHTKLNLTDSDKYWIVLQDGDWITLDGRYVTAADAERAGQVHRKEDGSFYITWDNPTLTDPLINSVERIAWVNAGQGAGTSRTVVATDDEKDWVMLTEGDYIDRTGKFLGRYVSSSQRKNAGRFDGTAIQWSDGVDGSGRILYDPMKPWKGHFYVKAKEDFIGGNAIDTNSSASIQIDDHVYNPETPTVNVRLLNMKHHDSVVTVYKGDIINEVGDAPIDSLEYFYVNTYFKKLISDDTNVLNKVAVDPDRNDGLEADKFYLRYAMGQDLTKDQWDRLQKGETITVPYNYDDASSHGNVGYFTFTMTKEGDSAAYESHEATHACPPQGELSGKKCETPVETYTLNITYTAYRLGELDAKGNELRPPENYNNGPASGPGPGIEVGIEPNEDQNVGTKLENGLGKIEKKNIHEVHVISGEIVIYKRFNGDYTADKDQTFTFTLHRTEDGTDTTNDMTATITIPAGASEGANYITFSGLKRGTYTVTEAVNDEYALKELTVEPGTNCFSTPAIGGTATELTFVMGNNVANENVIGKAGEDRYTSYIDPVNGVLGKAIFTNQKIIYEGEIPVTKVWDDGSGAHTDDVVYLVLYKDDLPVLDDQGRAKILRLDDSNGWTGKFTVTLANKLDKVTNYDYSVREVKKASPAAFDGASVAVLEGTADILIYYSDPVAQNGATAVGGRAYIVQYETGENGAWTVTNLRAIEIPETGGLGTHQYTISGWLLIAAALVYGYSQRRKRERRGS